MFSHLIGNDEVKDSLRRLLATGRATGSLLFTGEEGIGKKLFALELAKAFNCRNRLGSSTGTTNERQSNDQTLDSCSECSSCKRLARSTRGSLGRALATDIESYRERREAMLVVLTALALTGDRARLLRSAEDLAAAKDRDSYEQQLDVLESLIRDAWSLALGRPQEMLVNSDLLKPLQSIAAELTSKKAMSWLSQIEELRGALEVNLNRRIASDALFVSMAMA